MLLSLYYSVEIILRAEAVEVAQAGDKCDFTGTLIAVPDVRKLNVPGMYDFIVVYCLFMLPSLCEHKVMDL